MTQYQLLPDLTDEEYEALKADIATRGVMVPLEYDEEGRLLDGHHRERACMELGITEWPVIHRSGLTEQQKQEHVLALNLNRRHLSREQRAELVATLRGNGWSTPRIAEKLQVSDETVRRDLGVSTFVEPTTVTGKDGKQYPAQRVERPAAPQLDFVPQPSQPHPAPVMPEESEPAEDLVIAPPREPIEPPAVHAAQESHPPAKMAVHFSSETPEHYTPRAVLDAVVTCMGAIALDPCAENGDRPNVPAAQHFTRTDDGLSREWHGTVFMNPPYGNEIGDWLEKLCNEYEAGHLTDRPCRDWPTSGRMSAWI